MSGVVIPSQAGKRERAKGNSASVVLPAGDSVSPFTFAELRDEQLRLLQKFLLSPSQILETDHICPDGDKLLPLSYSVYFHIICVLPNTR